MSVVQKQSLLGNAIPQLEADDVVFFCKAIEDLAGIALKPTKQDLIRTRLASRLAAIGVTSFREYRRHLQGLPKDNPEWQRFTNLLTTNKTDFFREIKHFDFLVEQILPAWLKTSQRSFNVWSAASSTGEEPYTLAMVLERHIPKDREFKIHATDIDTNVLSKVKNAVYPIAKKEEIPTEFHQSSIDVGKGNARGWFRIKPQLKSKVSVHVHNLIEREIPEENFFDLVLCRNVLIYFSSEKIDFVQKKLVTIQRN